MFTNAMLYLCQAAYAAFHFEVVKKEGGNKHDACEKIPDPTIARPILQHPNDSRRV